MKETEKTRIIVTAVGVLSVLSLILGVYSYLGIVALDDRVDQITSSGTATPTPGNTTSEIPGNKSTGIILAYDQATNSGFAVDYTFEAVESSGIFIDTGGIIVGANFQNAIEESYDAVKKTGYNPRINGFKLGLATPARWEKLSGNSVGLVIAAELAATNPRYKLKQSVAFTGYVREDGSLEEVGSLEEKANAAAEKGKNIMIAPETTYPFRPPEEITVKYVSTVTEALNIALEHSSQN